MQLPLLEFPDAEPSGYEQGSSSLNSNEEIEKSLETVLMTPACDLSE